MILKEIDKQIKRIEDRIETERRVYEAWKILKETDIRTAVLHQCVGTIRGLEAGKEALEFIKGQEDPEIQLSADEWLIHEEHKKLQAEAVIRP